MKNFVDTYLTAKEIRAKHELTDPIAYPLSQFFPRVKQAGLKISYVKGVKSRPVILRASTFEDKVTFRGRLSASMEEHEMPYFKEAMALRPDELLDLEKLQNLGSEHRLVVDTFNKLYRDRTELINGALSRAEYLRAKVCQSGTIVIASNGVERTIDYGLEAEQFETLAGGDLWSDPTADVVSKLEAHIDLVKAREGVTPNAMMMTSTTFKLLKLNTQIQGLITQTVPLGSVVYYTDSMVYNVLQAVLGLRVLINDEMYQEEVAGTKTKYWADDKVMLFNTGVPLGTTTYGTTPEEILPRDQFDVETVEDNSISVWTHWDDNPVTKWTAVSMVCLPSAEGLGTIQVLTVTA